MNKHALIQQLINILRCDIDEHIKAAQQAHDAATHEQSKAETQYDTLGLEQAYLAQGQSERIEALQQQIVRLHHCELRDFSDDDSIYLSAVVELVNTQNPQTLNVMLLPCSGGYVLDHGIHTITPDTPLAKALKGQAVDDEIKLSNGQCYLISAIH